MLLPWLPQVAHIGRAIKEKMGRLRSGGGGDAAQPSYLSSTSQQCWVLPLQLRLRASTADPADASPALVRLDAAELELTEATQVRLLPVNSAHPTSQTDRRKPTSPPN